MKRLLFILFRGFIGLTSLQAAVITHDISTGNLTIPGTSTDDYIITGSTTTYKVVVSTGYHGSITLSNVSIQSLAPNTNTTTYSPFTVLGEYNCSNLAPVTKVEIILEGTNELLYTGAGYACLQVDQGAQIRISAIDPNDNASGVLTAKATPYVPGVNYSVAGAGIGAPGGNGSPLVPYRLQGTSPLSCGNTGNTAGGNIIIASGTITAWGGHGAGIGGGFQTYYNGIIIIYGGIVESRGGYDSAGIGSGCPTGTGVLTCYADVSTVVALPPSSIVAYGAGANANGGVGMIQFPSLGLTGTKNITYVNDPNKPLIYIRTEDFEPNANIYLDLTETPGLVEVFNALELNYDLARVKIGKTDASGYMSLHARFEQNTTFFTDASSSNPATPGRPYLPVSRIVLNTDTIILPLMDAEISFTDYPSTPLLEGYSVPEARQNAEVIKVNYNDPVPMSNMTYSLQEGINFPSLIFLGADSATVIAPPATLNFGDVFYIIVPIDAGKTANIYNDVLQIYGEYNSLPLSGPIRRVIEQQVVFDDSPTNDYIRVTASPNQFEVMYPATNTVNLTLNISHSGLNVPYDSAEVTAKYLVTTEPDYDLALAANPLNTWDLLNVPGNEGVDRITPVSFSGFTSGTYYIHWYAVSGVVMAHSLTVTSPPRLYGGFGPYKIMNVRAMDDTVQVIQNGQVLIPVKDNDSIVSSCAGIIPEITVFPVNGTTVMHNDTVLYTPAPGYTGKDSMVYRLVCSGDTSFAKVFIRVIEHPDNITDADCFIPVQPVTWGIREVPIYTDKLIHNYGPLITGDIDDDGKVEIVGLMPKNGAQNYYDSDGIRIFTFENDQVQFKKDIPFVGHTVASQGSYAMARYNGVGYIVLYGSNRRLYAYNAATGGAPLWQSDVLGSTTVAFSFVNIADFNNDGIPEVYCGNQIVSLATGALLCSGGAGNVGSLGYSAANTPNYGCSTMAADMDGDGQPELCAGTQIYRVNIPPGATAAGAGTMTVISDMQLPASVLPTEAHQDGATLVADVDNDGKPEVVVVSRKSSGGVNYGVAYVWKPLPGNASQLLGSFIVPSPPSNNSIPMIGNIDGDPYLEIIFLINGAVDDIYALEYDPLAALGSRISLKWRMAHTDGSSGCTGMSLFDFDLNGVNEIVYRDEQNLRIINGNTSTPDTLSIFYGVYSGTLHELPVIADIDADGQAEIIIQGYDGIVKTVEGIAAGIQNGYLRVFKSSGSPWAPTRKVWNQYSYNAVNINNDLTVPAYQMNPATVFPGQDGILGTADDIRPYNGVLMQQTLLNSFGEPLQLAPDVYTAPSLVQTVLSGNTLTVTVGIVNQGEAAIGPPVYVTLYREKSPQTYTAADTIAVGSINQQILPADTGYVTVQIPDITRFFPMANIVIRLNDDGITFPHQPECDETNDTLAIPNPAIALMMKKRATLNGVQFSGTYPNPGSVLFGDTVEYAITAVNASTVSGQNIVIVDTLPPYLEYAG
ncbi:MAG: hypothetical protein LBE91_21870, partial [Tannerella sp.]|nr:hypothetical protein [Tannerella sp.]